MKAGFDRFSSKSSGLGIHVPDWFEVAGSNHAVTVAATVVSVTAPPLELTLRPRPGIASKVLVAPSLVGTNTIRFARSVPRPCTKPVESIPLDALTAAWRGTLDW